MSRDTISGRRVHTRGRDWLRLVVLGLVVCAGFVTPTIGAGDLADAPEVTNVTTSTSGANVTLTVSAANATEIDVADVPDGWTVATHRDDFGSYLNQLESNDRLVWLWATPVSATVSVTFSVPADADSAAVTVVAYDGTTRGNATTVTVDPSTETPTDRPGTPTDPPSTSAPAPTATPIPTATQPSTAADPTATVTGAPEEVPPTATTTGDGPTDSSGGGPGPGPVLALAAVLLAVLALARRRSRE